MSDDLQSDRWRECLKSVGSVQPTPDLWERALEGPKRGVTTVAESRRRTYLIVVLATGVVIVGSLGAYVATRQQAAVAPTPGGLTIPAGRGLLAAGKKVTLDQAESEAGFKLYRPQSPLASDATIEAVYIQTTTGDETITEAEIDYTSGIVETIQLASAELSSDPEAFYNKRASEGPGRSVTSVNGLPALLIQPNAEGPGPSSISMVIQGAEVTLYGQYATFDTKVLETVAVTIS